MVFSYPCTGFRVTGGKVFQLLAREVDDAEEMETWPDVGGASGWGPAHILRLHDFDKVFALLRVNRQIYSEAMPVFFRNNQFYFCNLDEFCCFLVRISQARLQHIRHLYVCLDPGRGCASTVAHIFVRAMQKFAGISRLTKLTFELSDFAWLKLGRRERESLGRKVKYTKMEQIAGFRELATAASKAEELVFEGENKEVREYLEVEIRKIKAGDSVTSKAKKRARKAGATRKSREVVGKSESEGEKGGVKGSKAGKARKSQ